jgi:hypothetical protein
MSDTQSDASHTVELWEQPQSAEIYMLAGWQQWADAGSASSGLPKYVVEMTRARQIGRIDSTGFYLFQFPGTHDLVRPVVRFEKGVPVALEDPRNEFYYTGDERRGLVIFSGDEPHMDIERYVAAFLQAAKSLGVKRIIGLGGVYGELPYDKERTVTASCSLPNLREALDEYAVQLTDYQGGASIGSYICRRAGEQNLEYIGFYSFVPLFSFDGVSQPLSALRIENDYIAWVGLLRRVNYMFKLGLDLSDLEKRGQQLLRALDEKIDELDRAAPDLGIRQYVEKISREFTETPFSPLEDVWEDEIRRLMDKFEGDEPFNEGETSHPE